MWWQREWGALAAAAAALQCHSQCQACIQQLCLQSTAARSVSICGSGSGHCCNYPDCCITVPREAGACSTMPLLLLLLLCHVQACAFVCAHNPLSWHDYWSACTSTLGALTPGYAFPLPLASNCPAVFICVADCRAHWVCVCTCALMCLYQRWRLL